MAIDPGVHHSGVAMFTDNFLRCAFLCRPAKQVEIGPHAWTAMADAVQKSAASRWFSPGRVVIEFPRAYQGGKQQANNDDLLELAGVVGAIVDRMWALTPNIAYFRPSEWKGQLKKEQTTPRIIERLSVPEQAAIEHVGAKDHNIYDAIGIGLYDIGRFERRMVYAR